MLDHNGDGIIDWRDQVVIGQGDIVLDKWNFSAWTSARWGNWSVEFYLEQGASGYSIAFSGSLVGMIK